MFFRQGYAALGSLVAGIYDMQKNSASVVLNAWALVVVCGDHQIIGAIFAPQIFMAGINWKNYVLIIGPMERSVTPAIGLVHGPAVDASSWPSQFVGTIIKLFKLPFSNGTCAIAFALGKAAARFSEKARKCAIADFQYPTTRTRVSRVNVKICYRTAHGVLCCPYLINRSSLNPQLIASLEPHV